MKKVGIITLYGNENFGNKLQNYALQEILIENDCLVETLNNVSNISKDKVFDKKFIIARRIYRKIKKLKISIIDIKRKNK